MPRNGKLKVFRTSIGFHDAYVAAPSRKAALQAWGASKDLFGVGSAEVVTDSPLIVEPLAHPGTVIKRLRGSADEHVAAAGRQDALRRREAKKADKLGEVGNERPPSSPRRRPKPRPSRKALDNAAAALANYEQKAEEERAHLQQKMEALRRELSALEDLQEANAAKLRKRVQAARDRYENAMEMWRRQDE